MPTTSDRRREPRSRSANTFSAVAFIAIAGLGACSQHPRTQKDVVVTVTRATPPPPQAVAEQTVPALPESSFAANRASFEADSAQLESLPNSVVKTVGEKGATLATAPPQSQISAAPSSVPTGEVSVAPSASATGALAPSQSLGEAADSFRQLHQAIVGNLPGNKPVPAPPAEGFDYAGHGVLVRSSDRIRATYADQSVYPDLRFPASSQSYLYAPTMYGAHNSCIEVVTVYSSDPPAVWAWNWCTKSGPNPARTYLVNVAFILKYVRDLGSGVGEYTVQTSLLPDNMTWVARLFNYSSKEWDEIYRSSGASTSQSHGNGWDFFEENAQVDSENQSDYCRLLPPLFESTNVKISFDGKTFTRLDSGTAAILTKNSFTCNRLQFHLLDPLWHWTVTAKKR
jgi:hypothetical protein